MLSSSSNTMEKGDDSVATVKSPPTVGIDWLSVSGFPNTVLTVVCVL